MTASTPARPMGRPPRMEYPEGATCFIRVEVPAHLKVRILREHGQLQRTVPTLLAEALVAREMRDRLTAA